MPTSPPLIPGTPEAPQRGAKGTFPVLMDAFLKWIESNASKFGDLAANVYANAVEALSYSTAAGNSASASAAMAEAAATSAANSADSATAAAVTAGAGLWVSGQTVARDAAVISPLDRRTYRRKTASGSGTTDPSLDTTNYVLLSADSSSYIKLAEATISSAVANIDFLSIFSDAFPRYVVEIVGLKAASGGTFSVRMAAGGVVDSSTSYRQGGTLVDSMGFISMGGVTELSVSLQIRGARSTGASKSVEMAGASSDTNAIGSLYGWANTALASGFRLYMSSGANFTAGTVRIYGIRA